MVLRFGEQCLADDEAIVTIIMYSFGSRVSRSILPEDAFLEDGRGKIVSANHPIPILK